MEANMFQPDRVPDFFTMAGPGIAKASAPPIRYAPLTTAVLLLFFLLPRVLPAQIVGKPLWKQPLEGQVIGLPSVQGGSVVVLCEGGNLNAYSQQGNALWHYAAGGKLSPFITRSREGTNYICRTNGIFIAINRIGRELWRINLRDPLAGPVLIGWDGRLFVPTNQKIACYTAAGKLLWYTNLESPIAVPPQEDKQGGLVMVLGNGNLLRINAFGKTQVTQLPTVPAMVLSLAEGQAITKDPTAITRNEIPLLILYKDGATEIIGGTQEYPPPPRLPAYPLGAVSRNGKAAVTLQDGQVVLLSAVDGEVLWIGSSAITPGEQGNETTMIYDERGIYMLSKAGAAGFTEEGERLWFIRIIGAAAIPMFSDEGLLYSGGSDWNLYAYRLETRSILQQQSPYGPAPEGDYGLGRPFPPRRSDYSNRFSERELKNRFARIAKALQEGQVGEQEKDFTAYLMEVAGSLRNSIRPSLTNPPVQLQQRIKATQLLSYLGSKEIIPFLADLFSYDPDAPVKAAAAEAIGRIGLDPDGLALEAFAGALVSSAHIQDEQVLLSVAAAVGSLCRFSGPPLSGAGVKLLIALAGMDRPLRVRNRALEEIRSLQQ